MTMRWFGKFHNAPMQSDCPQTETPVGTVCAYCDEQILPDDDGMIDAGGSVYHRPCFLRPIIGSINHQLGLCSCFQKDAVEVDEPGTKREAAEAAMRFFLQSQRTKREVTKCIQ
jgi:hypothetical protein